MNTTTTQEVNAVFARHLSENNEQSPSDDLKRDGRDNGMTEPLRRAINDLESFRSYLKKSDY